VKKEFGSAFDECAKACNKTAGCIGVSVFEKKPDGPTMCQLFSKITNTTPENDPKKEAASCVNATRTTGKPTETYMKDPNAPYFVPPWLGLPGTPPPGGVFDTDANQPGAPGTPGPQRQRH
jgi:hypothetical protein